MKHVAEIKATISDVFSQSSGPLILTVSKKWECHGKVSSIRSLRFCEFYGDFWPFTFHDVSVGWRILITERWASHKYSWLECEPNSSHQARYSAFYKIWRTILFSVNLNNLFSNLYYRFVCLCPILLYNAHLLWSCPYLTIVEVL